MVFGYNSFFSVSTTQNFYLSDRFIILPTFTITLINICISVVISKHAVKTGTKAMDLCDAITAPFFASTPIEFYSAVKTILPFSHLFLAYALKWHPFHFLIMLDGVEHRGKSAKPRCVWHITYTHSDIKAYDFLNHLPWKQFEKKLHSTEINRKVTLLFSYTFMGYSRGVRNMYVMLLNCVLASLVLGNNANVEKVYEACICIPIYLHSFYPYSLLGSIALSPNTVFVC